MRIMRNSLSGIGVAALVAGMTASAAGGPSTITMPDEVKAVIQKNCAVCHKGKYPPQKLNLESASLPASIVDMPSAEQPGLKLVDSESPGSSYLLKKIRGAEGISGKRMPPPVKPALTSEELALLENWILGLKESCYPPEGGDRIRGPREEPELVPASTGGQAAPAGGPQARAEGPTFWGTRLVSLPTGQTMEKGDFLLRISHRFVPSVRSGYDTFWGFDGSATVLLSFGYGISDRLGITLGRTNLSQELELSATWVAMEQDGTGGLPFSVAVNGGIDLAAQKRNDRGAFDSRHFKIAAQVILSRRINRRLSVLVVPAYASNTNHWEEDPEGTFAVGLGGRFMLLEGLSVIAEWTPVHAGYKEIANGWGLGLEKKIGLHVFQAFVTNSIGLTSSQFVTGGDLRLGKGDFRFGFNIFRTF